MPEPVLDLQGFAARLANGPAFLLLGGSAEDGDGPAAEYRWSGVYTTRTDAATANRFRADWRTIVPVGAMASTPSRSQSELEICYLLGGQGLPEDQRPPADPVQLADARMRCIQELTRLATDCTNNSEIGSRVLLQIRSPGGVVVHKTCVRPLTC